MKKLLVMVFAASAMLAMGDAPKNLLPLPQIQQNRSLGDGAGKWHRTYVDTKTVTAKLTVGTNGTLNIQREGKPGSSAWRINLPELAAGTYTLDTDVNCSGKAIIAIYGFYASGKAKLLYLKRFTTVADQKVRENFDIPEGMVKVRFGFGVEDNGNAAYQMPRLFAGKLSSDELPPRK